MYNSCTNSSSPAEFALCTVYSLMTLTTENVVISIYSSETSWELPRKKILCHDLKNTEHWKSQTLRNYIKDRTFTGLHVNKYIYPRCVFKYKIWGTTNTIQVIPFDDTLYFYSFYSIYTAHTKIWINDKICWYYFKVKFLKSN